MAHSNWAEWIYLGVVTALLIYVGAEAWNVERIIDHAPEDAEIIKVLLSSGFGVLSMKMVQRKWVSFT